MSTHPSAHPQILRALHHDTSQEVNAFLWPLFVEHLPLGACVYTYTFSLLPEVQPKCDDRDSDASTQLEHDPSATKTPSAFQWAPEQVVDGKSSFDRLRLYRVTSDVRASYRAWVAASAKATKGTEAAQ